MTGVYLENKLKLALALTLKLLFTFFCRSYCASKKLAYALLGVLYG
jgi:hypothetical protein